MLARTPAEGFPPGWEATGENGSLFPGKQLRENRARQSSTGSMDRPTGRERERELERKSARARD